MNFDGNFGGRFESFHRNENSIKVQNQNMSLLHDQKNLHFSNEITKTFNKKRIFLEKYYGESLELKEDESIKEELEAEDKGEMISRREPQILRKETFSYYNNEDCLIPYEIKTGSERISSEIQRNIVRNPSSDLGNYFSCDNNKNEFIPQLGSLNIENERETMKTPYFKVEQQISNVTLETYPDSPSNKQRHIFYNDHSQSNYYDEEEQQNGYEQNCSDFPYMNESYQTQDEFCSQFCSREEPLDLSVPKDETTITNFNFCSQYDETRSEFLLKGEFADQNSWLKKIKTGTRSRVRSPKSWEFLLRLLMDPKSNPSMIRWEDETTGTFRLVQKDEIAKIWGMRSTKHKDGGLSYDNFARNLRYHYKTKMLVPVSEKHLVYKFSNEVMEKKHSFLS